MKRLWVICLIIVAIASVGFGYGVWSQNFNSLGPVSTGAYDVVFDSFTAPSPTLGATFSVYQVNSHTCDISLNNLYPTYTPTFNFVLKDTGSVPAKITDVKINGTSIVSGGSLTNTNIALGSDINNDITVTVSGINASGPNSLITANNGTLSGSLTVRTWAKISSDANDAAANASGSFMFEIDTAQNP
jgi:hypothetical protein